MGDAIGLELGFASGRREIALHDVDPSQPGLPPLTTYAQRRYDPPRWTTDPALWERAGELFHQPVPLSEVGFVHRDFNPGNLLWVREPAERSCRLAVGVCRASLD